MLELERKRWSLGVLGGCKLEVMGVEIRHARGSG